MTRSFALRLLAWFDRERRDLPWRTNPDPWRVWVSEVMLQQTRVEAVRVPFERFIAEFPQPADFAAADDDALLRVWRGLGYYRRARLLRAGAREVVEHHGGRVPTSSSALGKLSGIGQYTRGAIASIAFGESVAAVDGNVERVLARHLAMRDNVKRGPTQRMLAAEVLERMDRRRPGDFNQALMELGALICTPRSPRCDACPIASDCQARQQGVTTQLPVLPARRAVVAVQSRAVLVLGNATSALAIRIPDGAPNAGQLELPGPGILAPCSTPGDLEVELADRGFRIDVGPELATIKHSITHHRITLTVHGGRLRGRAPAAAVTACVVDPNSPWSTASRKAFGKIDGLIAAN